MFFSPRKLTTIGVTVSVSIIRATLCKFTTQ